ncbi:MAG: 2-oxo acid dehydrogenase subunit E2, partial [FCB group bacterium]
MLDLNTAFEDEIYSQYIKDPLSVSPAWRDYFEKNPGTNGTHYEEQPNKEVLQKKVQKIANPEFRIQNSELKEDIYIDPEAELIRLSPIQSQISHNMEISTELPSATSLRTIPVKVLDENRRIINKYLIKLKRPKVSFTQVLAWAIVKALMKYPHMNNAFLKKDNIPYRIKRKAINIGLAIDVVKKD